MRDHTPSGPSPALDPALLRTLADRLGGGAVVSDPERLAPYASDALSTIRGSPLALLRPASAEDLRAAVALLADHGVPFVARGAGSGLAGAATPVGAVVIATERMNRILRVDPEERVAVVEPGVVTDRISEAAEPHGLRYAPDPASSSFSTVGGNVAANAGGPHCLKHGVTGDHVLALEVVTPDGGRAVLGRDEEGLDLVGLFVGSEGTLGIATRIAVRLVPLPPARGTALALFDRLADAGAGVNRILAAGVVPAALELVDGATIRALEDSEHAVGLPTDAAAALILEVEGFPEEVRADLAAAEEALEGAGAARLRVAEDEARRARLWEARRKAYRALEGRGPDLLVQDATVPRSALPDVLPCIQEIAAEHELRIVTFAHAGDGNLHPNFLFDAGDPDQVDRVRAATREIARLCVEAGGTITGEHGVGLDKKDLLPLIFGPAELRLGRALKASVDPRGLANPGKLFPDEPAGEAADRPSGAPPGPRRGARGP